jgi:hypothetical protein
MRQLFGSENALICNTAILMTARVLFIFTGLAFVK